MKSTIITKVEALEILDSRGNPTVQATVWADGISAAASVPSGASTGVHEAWELRDGGKRYGGKGVLKAVKNVNEKIAKAVVGVDAADQKKLDTTMRELDGSQNKKKLGANAMLSVSLAAAKLAAKNNGMELFRYVAEQHNPNAPTHIPTPLFNVINGGAHADSGLDIQEYFIIPQKGKFSEKLRAGAEVYHTLKQQLVKQNLSVGVGDEGGFAPKLKNNEEAFKQLEKAIATAGFKLGSDFRLGIDAASSEFYNDKTGNYELKASGIKCKPASMHQLYKKWIDKYHLQIIEDGCSEDDFLGWKFLTQNLGKSTLLVGDDLFVTNPQRITMGITQKIANAVLIKPNQIGTLTETIEAIQLAHKHGYTTVMSHRSGETCDSFISDLAVAMGCAYIKAGAPCRAERLAKYNRLLEIEHII